MQDALRRSDSHTCRTSVPVVPCLRPGALPCPVRAPHPLEKTYALPNTTYVVRVPVQTPARDSNDLEDRRRPREGVVQEILHSVLPTSPPTGGAGSTPSGGFSKTAPA